MRLKRWMASLALAVIGTAASALYGSAPRRIEITASRFSYTPSKITLKRGEPVVLALTSRDVTHGLAIKELGIKKEIPKGQTTEVDITPMETGTFQGNCSHFCGKGHVGMTLTIDVEN